MAALFISDLHIDASRPAITEQFLKFLATEAKDADALYILGDLFESWVGDDAADAVQTAAIAGLSALSGLKRGLVATALSLAGLAAGAVLGARLAPLISAEQLSRVFAIVPSATDVTMLIEQAWGWTSAYGASSTVPPIPTKVASPNR